ncbi:probetacellulin-like isoform X1 [Schistocerca americana]|uniref:probetacellulin-like n=2 Tax=Schistocerca TaxID=7008 RepID=UPI001F4F637D|nr:probetacellulin-like isoform X1 [Schistocerca americana]XP_047104457.1 probetacellulin-like [Schistocerca piceifrons]XP_049939424.1 probetacellulin-like isoform X1 [Schistocerca serialis cubense]
MKEHFYDNSPLGFASSPKFQTMDSDFSRDEWSPGPWSPAEVLVARTLTCLCATLASRFYRFLARFSGRRRAPPQARPAVGRQHPCRMPPPLATIVLVVSTVLSIAEACSSRSTPKPRSAAPTARPNVTFHTYDCPPTYAKWYCLNHATCFVVKIGDSLLYNCECADGYMGQRCEYKDLDGTYLPSRQRVMLETASIAGGATIAVFLVVFVCIAVYIHLQRKQKELRASCTDGSSRDLEQRPFSRDVLAISIGRSNQTQNSSESHMPVETAGFTTLVTHAGTEQLPSSQWHQPVSRA